MADIFLSPLIQVLLDRLASAAAEKFGESRSVTGKIKKVRDTFLRIQAVLVSAEEQQVTDMATRLWLSKLKEATYEAEDLLDDLTAEFSLHRWNQTLKAAEIATKLNKMLSVFCNIADDAPMRIREGFADRCPEEKSVGRRQTGSSVIESEVCGRDKEKKEIVALLLSNPTPYTTKTNPGDVSVIPIVGIGGIGKTTLAQLAYNDEKVSKHFDLKMWVWVSDNFIVKKIIEESIESGMKKRCKLASGMDALQSQLQDLLRGKRYLLVLDDVWSEDGEAWDDLRMLFRGDVGGSKIIVTTRSRKVAGIIGTTSPYDLKGLPEDNCWKLFKQRAFGMGEEEKHPNLIPIGKEIVKKCGGVPLAAKSLGSLMRFKRAEREWLYVQNSELWNLGESQSGMLPALRLSYHHLPSHLKHCFTFCSVFPKKYEIKKEKLVHLWMAEGLIQSDGRRLPESRLPEDIGNEYFDDLLSMSFFEAVNNCDDGSVTGYKMHDLIHDLARSLGGNDSVIWEHHLPPTDVALTRRAYVAFYNFQSSIIQDHLHEAKHLRTLLYSLAVDFWEPLHFISSYFRYLRVLDLSGCGITRLDDSIVSLRFLRYLDLSYTPINSLSDNICSLRYLQIVNLFNCNMLVELPTRMATMLQLRHLNISGCRALIEMPPFMGSLRALKVLPIYIASRGYDRGIGQLCFLDLHGELIIKHLESVSDAEEAEAADLMMKENLESLGLHWGNYDDSPNRNPAVEFSLLDRKELRLSGPSHGPVPDAVLGEKVLEGLQPHKNLKQLCIKGYPGVRFPSWTLPNLTLVDLANCRGCEHLPVLGNLPLLKTLLLQGMDSVKCIGEEFYGEDTWRPFPSLRELVIQDFPNLKEWLSCDNRDTFPSLIKLIVNKCPNLTRMPFFQYLEHLELRDCNHSILESVKNLTYLLNLVIEKVPELLALSGEVLANNSLLRSLEIVSCPKLHKLPSELANLTTLKSLTIRQCEELSYLPQGLQNLKALESLEISDCHNIISLPEDGLGGWSSLQTLSVEFCNNLNSLPTSFQHLASLEHLTIMYCPNISALPESVQHLKALRSLTILSCPGLLSLPEGLQYVTNLHCLEIGDCPGLKALLESVVNLTSLRSLRISDCENLKHLPEGLKLLSGLQHICIQGCPELEARCKPRSGEEWLKISHIPYKRIGSLQHRQSGVVGSTSG